MLLDTGYSMYHQKCVCNDDIPKHTASNVLKVSNGNRTGKPFTRIHVCKFAKRAPQLNQRFRVDNENLSKMPTILCNVVHFEPWAKDRRCSSLKRCSHGCC
eukprot:746734-Amphidinium_carterae.1